MTNTLLLVLLLGGLGYGLWLLRRLTESTSPIPRIAQGLDGQGTDLVIRLERAKADLAQTLASNARDQENRLATLEADIRQLVGSLAHDLREPLASGEQAMSEGVGKVVYGIGQIRERVGQLEETVERLAKRQEHALLNAWDEQRHALERAWEQESGRRDDRWSKMEGHIRFDMAQTREVVAPLVADQRALRDDMSRLVEDVVAVGQSVTEAVAGTRDAMVQMQADARPPLTVEAAPKVNFTLPPGLVEAAARRGVGAEEFQRLAKQAFQELVAVEP